MKNAPDRPGVRWAVLLAFATGALLLVWASGKWDLGNLQNWTEDPPLNISPTGWFFIFLFSTFITEDLTCIFAGLLISQGVVDFLPATLACFTGIFLGDGALFLIGRYWGRDALQWKWVRKLISPQAEARAERFFKARGPWIILATRFLPGARLPTYFAAGVMRSHPGSFFFYFALAGLAWTPLLVGLAVIVGNQLIPTFESYAAWALPAFLVTGAFLFLSLRSIERLATWKGRQLLKSRFHRWNQWEFWPPFLFYPPVVLYVAWLGLRYRSITLPGLANPGIPLGGFVGESKSDILHSLQTHRPNAIARFICLDSQDASASLETIRQFQSALKQPWPIVWKPDTGERGKGVHILENEEMLKAALSDNPGRFIIQEYIEGLEFGVFYIHYPGAAKGEIFSITDKQLLTVTGDGKSTLCRLILQHPRALSMAPTFLKRFPDAEDRVPQKGETVKLVEVGTHCQGALFLDSTREATAALEQTIRRISEGLPGFHFGRYDLRVPSLEDLKAGQHLKVLELNGLTSEATHIYHPGTPLWKAYGTLFRQWRHAFAIGAINRKAGATPPSLMEVGKALWNHYR